MDDGKVEQQILRFVRKRFPLARRNDVGKSSALLESGIIDSLGMLELVSMLEENFKIVIRDDDLTRDNFAAVSNIARLVTRRSSVDI